ncbi:MAG: hypothetical protein E4H20_01935 [Spirochaetales bacterium]|nr:MAG: hypothetical protein E4H20_01935 [Spirochaetales bacterium]
MSSYYYFAATLPALRYDSPPPMGYAEFLERASYCLNPRDLSVVEGARLYIPEDGSYPPSSGMSPLLTRYYRWERALRNELARLRAQRIQKTADRFVRPGELEWDGVRVAQAAFQADDPLQSELTIERERWSFIEFHAANHFFDIDCLAAYALLLQALERRARFTAEAGEAGYGTVYRSVLDTAEYRDESGEQR